MKLFKNIMKVVVAYSICLLFAYIVVINVRQIDESNKKVLQENNVEEYYVWEK